MSADVSLVLVAYRSSAVAPTAVASFRREAGRLGVSSEVVIVDHSEDPGEASCLRSLETETLLVLPNRGYAAGVNAGVAASEGAVVLVGNPDVALQEDALAPLLGGIRAGWDIVGPQFVLAGFLFPPTDLQTPCEELLRWLASRSQAVWRRQLRRELQRWRRIWEAREPVPVRALSGALLAFRRETFDRVGPWDEGFFLYFEETDWLRRAAASGLRIAQVPAARVVHVWGHAADPRACGEHFLASRARFFAMHYGWRGRFASRLRQGRSPLRMGSLPATPEGLPDEKRLWLLSPTALGMPAAGFLGSAAELGEALRGVATARGRAASYVVLAVEPGRWGLTGAWSWESGNG